MPDRINLILNDRESGSVALLNRLVAALEKELQGNDPDIEAFRNLVTGIREKLHHFAAIENFFVSLITHISHESAFPGEALQFIKDYRVYWKDSAGKIAENFLKLFSPEGKTILTHSHSETVITLFARLQSRQIPFRVVQTLSSPGEEGKLSLGRMGKLKIQAELIADGNVKEVLDSIDLVLVGCDALLASEFLNKTGTRTILELAGKFHKPCVVVAESRKEIIPPAWRRGLTDQPLFEWVPLDLVSHIVTERAG